MGKDNGLDRDARGLDSLGSIACAGLVATRRPRADLAGGAGERSSPHHPRDGGCALQPVIVVSPHRAPVTKFKSSMGSPVFRSSSPVDDEAGAAAVTQKSSNSAARMWGALASASVGSRQELAGTTVGRSPTLGSWSGKLPPPIPTASNQFLAAFITTSSTRST